MIIQQPMLLHDRCHPAAALEQLAPTDKLIP